MPTFEKIVKVKRLREISEFFYCLNFWKSKDKAGWVIHPLPLLTAVGNDKGSGDFHEGNIGYEFVGSWAWNLISIDEKVPNNFKKIDVVFKEIL